MKLHTKILLGLILGAILGPLMGSVALAIEPLGQAFVNLLVMIGWPSLVYEPAPGALQHALSLTYGNP